MWWAQTREAAEDRLADLGFTFRTVGDGDTVTDQTPAGGAIVPGNASIILYLGQEKPDTPCTVPNVVGKTRLRGQQGHHQRRTYHEGHRHHHRQLRQCLRHHPVPPAGTEVAAGTVVTVQFGDNSVLD